MDHITATSTQVIKASGSVTGFHVKNSVIQPIMDVGWMWATPETRLPAVTVVQNELNPARAERPDPDNSFRYCGSTRKRVSDHQGRAQRRAKAGDEYAYCILRPYATLGKVTEYPR